MFTPNACIDILYNYQPLLFKEQALCKIPVASLGKKVAIIGAGAAGLVAAHELLKMGVKPVIYEASNRIGGRLYSQPFQQLDEDIQPFSELGAMRIPLSSRIFFHYAKKLTCVIKHYSQTQE